MIKKARDIQLGDRIGGRTISRKWQLVNAAGRYADSFSFKFADTLGNNEVYTSNGDQDVWVDDPAPCCKPYPKFTLITKRADSIQVGDMLCFKVTGNTGEHGFYDWALAPDADVLVLIGGDNAPDLTKLSEVLS